jgi:SET domain-containing protein
VPSATVIVGPSPRHGRGVFAAAPFAPGDLVEACPVLVVPAEQVANLDDTALYDYYFSWRGGAAAIALGYGSLYNHAAVPNARYQDDADTATIRFLAVRAIAVGDEITVDYSQGGAVPLWFTAADEAGPDGAPPAVPPA